MNISCIRFIAENITYQEVCGKKVVEVGALDFNGSPRYVLQLLNPREYVGVDMESGNGVDIVCPAENVVERFGENVFDIVVSTEMLEHALEWKTAISNLKRALKPNGLLLITTRSRGFKYHAYPYDFWRYELEDFQNIFSDMEIIKLEKDIVSPGVFLKARKHENFIEKDLTGIAIYNIVLDRTVKFLDPESSVFKAKAKQILSREEQKAKRKLRKAKRKQLKRQIYGFLGQLLYKAQ
jgi:SAM-dependent methyltransferase